MKFNMGCGLNKLDGYVNIDKVADCLPDLVMDLEIFPWKIQDNHASEIFFNHSLEHIGGDPNIFLNLFKELYRVCSDGAIVRINAPHPRHDFFLGDPTHVRPITPMVLALFSKRNCLDWAEKKISNSPLALYLNVDFELISCTQVLDDFYAKRLDAGIISNEDLNQIISERNNVIVEYQFELKVVKG